MSSLNTRKYGPENSPYLDTFQVVFPLKICQWLAWSKILSLKYPHLQLLIQTSQVYMGSWFKLPKSKHCYFFNITLPWMKIWKWRCSRQWFPSAWEISMSKIQAHRSYSQKTFYELSWNAQLCLIFISMSF